MGEYFQNMFFKLYKIYTKNNLEKLDIVAENDKNYEKSNYYVRRDKDYSELFGYPILLASYDMYSSLYDDTETYCTLINENTGKRLEPFEYFSFNRDSKTDDGLYIWKYDFDSTPFEDFNGVRIYNSNTKEWKYFANIYYTDNDGLYFIIKSNGSVYSAENYFYIANSGELVKVTDDNTVPDEFLTDKEKEIKDREACEYYYFDEDGWYDSEEPEEDYKHVAVNYNCEAI